MNFYKHHIGDYGKKTAHLSLPEHGAYLLMLQAYYATEKPLPTGKPLYRLLRAETKIERQAVDSIISQFWRVTDAGLTNDRADDEIERASHQREVNRELGKRGGRPKQSQSETESVSESLTDQQANRNPPKTPDSRLQTKTSEHPSGAETRARKRAAPSARTCPADFEVTADMRAWAAEHCPGIDVDRETEIFRDYTFATAKSDWVKTWRNWMRKAKPINGSHSRPTRYEELRQRAGNWNPAAPTTNPLLIEVKP